MGYIPAPSRGVLKIQAVAPAPIGNTAWWNTVDGNLYRYSDALADWVPVGTPDDAGSMTQLGNVDSTHGPNGIAIGDAETNGIDGAVAIGDGAETEAIPS